MMMESARKMGWSCRRRFPRGIHPILDSLSGIHRTREPVTHMPTLIKWLRSDDFHKRMDACVDIAAIAEKDPEKAKDALPVLREAFLKWGQLSKTMISEVFVKIRDGWALPVLIRHRDQKHPEAKERLEWAIRNIPAVDLKVIGKGRDDI